MYAIRSYYARVLYWNKFAAGIAVFQTNILTGAFVFGFNFLIGAEMLGIEESFNLARNPELLRNNFV